MRAWMASSSMRTSPTACSSSACVTPRNLSMRGRCLPSQAPRRPREQQRPRRRRRRAARCRGRLAAPSRPRADPAPSSAARPGDRRAGACGPRAPGTSSRSATARTGHDALEPDRVVLAHGAHARARGPPPCVPVDRREELRERALEARAGAADARRRARAGSASAPGWSCRRQRQDLVADQPALRVGVRRVGAIRRGRAPRSSARCPRARCSSRGRTTPSSRLGLIPFVLPDETRR